MAERVADVAEPEQKKFSTMRQNFLQDDEQIGVEMKTNYGTLALSTPAAQNAQSHKESSSRAALSRTSSTYI